MRIVFSAALGLLMAMLMLLLIYSAQAPAVGAQATWVWPVGSGAVASPFDEPDTPYSAGHRGIDIHAAAGSAVRAVAAGRVVHAGSVGGVPVVSIEHDGERSTYQPVKASVQRGDSVTRGHVIGRLAAADHHCATSCLHLGRLRDQTYLDPLEALGAAQFVLISPDGPPPDPPSGFMGQLLLPVAGPVTSAFGMRTHPITGHRKLHDGTDFGAPCGSPVGAAHDGMVISASVAGAYGLRVDVRHSESLVTGYAHLSSANVGVGERVRRGQQLGRVGNTGLSTGCHLHFMVIREGRPISPW